MPAVTVDLVKNQAGENKKYRHKVFHPNLFLYKILFPSFKQTQHWQNYDLYFLYFILNRLKSSYKFINQKTLLLWFLPLHLHHHISHSGAVMASEKKKWEAAIACEFRACFHAIVMKEGKNTICDYKYSKRYKYSKQDGFMLP